MARYDPTSNDPDRQYTHQKEQELWDQFRYKALDPMKYDRPKITPIGNQLGMHQQQTRDTVRTWENAGLVSVSRSNYNSAALTKRGKYTIDPRDPADDDEIPD